MRIISEFETQFKLGQSSLSKIKIDYTSRDDITKFLLGIQSIPLNKEGQAKIFQILEKTINIKSIGRSGMSLWRILVLGLLRQVINADYDRVCNLANNHAELRKFVSVNFSALYDAAKSLASMLYGRIARNSPLFFALRIFSNKYRK